MSVSLTIYIKKISNEHHEFRYVRLDGTGEAITLKSKDVLLYDLIHYCVERRAKLENSLYGLLAKNKTYNEVSNMDPIDDNFGNELGMTKRIVGGLTPVMRGLIPSEQFLAGAKNLLSSYSKSIPYWLDQGIIADSETDLKMIIGEWNGIAFGDTIILKFNIY